MSLVKLCLEVAKGIPGASLLAGGGLVFRRRGFEGRVEFGGRDQATGGWTEFMFNTASLATAPLQVRTGGLWHDLKNLLGFHDLRVGDPAFDDRFDVSAGEPGMAVAILTPAVRSILGHVSIYGDFSWRISRAGFLLRIHGQPATSKELDGWLGSAFQLLDALPGAAHADRVQLDRVEIAIDGDSSCQVCGASLAQGAVVRCATCATPHHRDCWEFNGRCSTFACGETRAL